MSDNPSFILTKIENVVFEDRPIPSIADDEVLVEVKKTGICGSDIHYLVHGRIGDFVVEKPMVLGHESSGVVSKVGPKVKHLKAGDRVALEPGQTCRVCDDCKRGKYELCPDVIFAATPPYDGTLARYYRIASDLAYKLPDHLSLEDGAMMEPLSVAVHSVSTLSQLKSGQSIAIFGCGPIGLLCMAVAKALGARRIIAVDIVQERLSFAQTYAGSEGFLPPKMLEGEARTAYSRRATAELSEALGVEGRGEKSVDVVIDATGAEVCIQMGMHLVKYGGTFVQVGMGAPDVTVPIGLFLTKELTVHGSFRYGPGSYQLAISLAAQGKIDLKPLVTHRFTFEEAASAFAATRAGKTDDGKGVIKTIISGPGVKTDEN